MKQILLSLMFLSLATIYGQHTLGEYKLFLSQYGLKQKVMLRTIEFEEISKEERGENRIKIEEKREIAYYP